jgi:hypothetical protein
MQQELPQQFGKRTDGRGGLSMKKKTTAEQHKEKIPKQKATNRPEGTALPQIASAKPKRGGLYTRYNNPGTSGGSRAPKRRTSKLNTEIYRVLPGSTGSTGQFSKF